MEIVNETGFCVDANQSIDKHGQYYLVAVAKATYRIPSEDNDTVELADDQVPIFDADVFEGEPGLSTTYFESDWAFRKRRCDVVLKATAYAPEGKPVTGVGVKFQVGECAKALKVVGERIWQPSAVGGLKVNKAKPFTSMPVTYGRSYGGTWLDENEKPALFMANPVGCGFGKQRHHAKMVGTSAPCVGPLSEAFDTHTHAFKPGSFGPIGRHWEGRVHYAGTYDQIWKDSVFPLLPGDFDERFYQCAPEDQQITYPKGGEKVSLWNMHPTRRQIHFKLPHQLKLPMVAIMQNRRQEPLETVVDTLTVDMDEEVVSLVWRAQLPISRSLREIKTLVAGEVYEELWDKLVYGVDSTCDGCGV